MSDKLNLEVRENIPTVITEMIANHGTFTYSDIIDGLLCHYSPDLLLESIRKKTNTKHKSQNDRFMVGLNVYRYIFDTGVSKREAITKISNDTYSENSLTQGITPSTVKNNVENFENDIKEDMKFFYAYEKVTDYLNDFFKYFDSTNNYWDDRLHKRHYREIYDKFIKENSTPF